MLGGGGPFAYSRDVLSDLGGQSFDVMGIPRVVVGNPASGGGFGYQAKQQAASQQSRKTRPPNGR